MKHIIPVLSSSDIERDIAWYEHQTGFAPIFGDQLYCGLSRDDMELHLQWHHGDDSDPVLGSVIKIFVDDLDPYYHEFIKRGTISPEKLRRNTPWQTHEFGFYDLNGNAIFYVQDVPGK